MKAVAIGRLGAATKLLQTQRRDGQWRLQDFFNRGAFHPFAEEPTRSQVRAIFKISRATIAVEKNATRRESVE